MSPVGMMQILDDELAAMHDAWPSFVVHMNDKQYGYEALNVAWAWYSAGWEAREERVR